MNARLYSLFLSFYPAELRRDFGAEMTEVFLEDLKDAHRSCGVIGVVHVWWRSVRELFRIVLPEQAMRREVIVPCVMWLLEIFYFSAILLAHPELHIDMPNTPRGVVEPILGWGVAPALMALIALRVGDRSIPVPLDLRPR